MSRHTIAPSVVAAGWFGCFGLALAGMMFLRPALGRDLASVVSYVVLPGIASAVAGSMVGRVVLDRARTATAWKAAAVGIAAAVVAFAVYAPLFAIAITMVESD